jgi:hypothetical protein
MALGSLVGMVAVLSLAAIPSVANRQASRLALQQFALAPPGSAPTLYGSLVAESYVGKQMTRLVVAPAATTASPPSWLKRYPKPGEIAVSPSLAKLIESDPTLAARFPQRQIQALGPDVLVAPDQLLAVVGAARNDLPRDGNGLVEATGFATEGSNWEGPDPRAVRLLAVGAAVFVLLPLAAFLSTGARLSARTRRDRLALLRMIGMSPRATAAVGWVEILAASLIGSVLGYAMWRAAVPWSQGIGLGHLHWYATDVTASAATAFVVMVVLAAISVAVAHRSMTTAVTDPLGERQASPRPQPRRRPLIVFASGLACLAVCVAWPTPSASTTTWWFALFVGGNALAAGGLLTGLPALAATVSRLVGRRPRPDAQIASGRLALDPHMAARMMTGLLVVVIIAGFGQSLLLVLDWAASDGPPEAAVGEPFDVYAPVTHTAIAQIEGVDIVAGSTLMSTAGGDSVIVAIAPCRDLLRLFHHEGRCTDSTPQPVVITATSDEPSVIPGHPIVLWRGELGSESGVASARMTPGQAETLGLANPIRWTVRLRAGADPERFKSRLLAIAPGAEATVGPDLERGRLVSTYATLVTAATVIALVLCMASTLAVLIDQTLERKTQSVQLLAIGVPGRLLRQAGAWWIGTPLFFALGFAGLTGMLSATAYLRFGEGSLHLRSDDLLAMAAVGATGLGLAVGAVVAFTPTTLDPDELDRQS